MDKKYYVLYLIPSRPDFAQTLTDEERSIMQQHFIYLKRYLDQGVLLVFGPVSDPKGTYGIAIAGVETEEQLRTLMDNDPASRINTYEFYPMRAITSMQ